MSPEMAAQWAAFGSVALATATSGLQMLSNRLNRKGGKQKDMAANARAERHAQSLQEMATQVSAMNATVQNQQAAGAAMSMLVNQLEKRLERVERERDR